MMFSVLSEDFSGVVYAAGGRCGIAVAVLRYWVVGFFRVFQRASKAP
jgi:hypothetical protein